MSLMFVAPPPAGNLDDEEQDGQEPRRGPSVGSRLTTHAAVRANSNPNGNP